MTMFTVLINMTTTTTRKTITNLLLCLLLLLLPLPLLRTVYGGRLFVPCRTVVLSGRKGWYSTRMRLSSSRRSQIRPATNDKWLRPHQLLRASTDGYVPSGYLTTDRALHLYPVYTIKKTPSECIQNTRVF